MINIIDEKKMEELKISLPTSIKEWINKEADKNGISEEVFIKKILSEYAEEEKEANHRKNPENNKYKEFIDEYSKILRKF